MNEETKAWIKSHWDSLLHVAYVYIRVTLHWTSTEVVVHHGAISIVS
jgi:hypothetical protein